MKRRLLLLSVFLLALSASLIFVGCGNDDEEPEQPTMPTGEMFNMNVSLFESPPAYFSRAMTDSMRCPHFDTAAVIVVVWGALTKLYFVLPQLAFWLALTQPVTYEGDKTWRWQFGSDTNNFALTTQLSESGDSASWQMQITNPTYENEFLWYDGRCDIHATGGWWRFYEQNHESSGNEVLWVSWSKNQDGTAADLVITSTDEMHACYGDSIAYAINGTAAQASIHDIAGQRQGKWIMQWDTAQYCGSIKYPDDSTYCWDDSLRCCECGN